MDDAGTLLTPRAEHTLHALRQSRRPRRVRVGRRQLLAGAGLVAVGAVVAVGGGTLVPDTAAPAPVAYTPPVLSLHPVEGQSARAFLLAFAQRVEALEPEEAQGVYQYSKTWGWWLDTAGDVPGGVANAAVPTVIESWVDKDGSGRQRSAYGEPLYPNPEQRRDAEEAGLVADTGVEDRSFGPGKFPAPEGGDWGTVAPFSTDPRALARQLTKVNWEGGMIVHGVRDMLTYAGKTGAVDPRLRAAALQVLADSTGVTVATTTTWNGRRAVAVSQSETLDGSTQRETVLFDPETGYPVGTESALLGHARHLNVSVPATLAVTETLDRSSVSTTGERP
ncbi:CU044_5270 family protein [Streptomyces sp. NBC_00287]|uniref:CU044_5270 family protein n=1 Tax=Streptomyces sp. NBC_00287 TaxID=2975702 RepID=UPI002E2994AA|nr:CU044_5270 family protein [Streptomyces sp. NBC_00287]